MDWEKLAGIESPVDEDEVEAQINVHLGGSRGLEGREKGPDGEWRDKPVWRIETEGAANWALVKVAEARERERRYQAEIDLWQRALRQIKGAADFLEERLKEWAVAQRTKARKSFPLAHGTVSTRDVKPRIVVDDEHEAVAWAEAHCPGAVKVTKEFRVSEAKEQLRIVPIVEGFVATNRATGEVERIEVEWAPLDEDKLAQLRERMEGWSVEPITGGAIVVDDGGKVVPGLSVIPGRISATVTPLGM